MGRQLLNSVGDRIGRLTLLEHEFRGRWRCRCDCGREALTTGSNLRAGNTQSCGCLNRVLSADRQRTHGLTGSPEYIAWAAAKGRCTNPANREWRFYGGRGIRMAQEWLESFETFLGAIGPRPSSRHSLDRIDSNGDYAPGNVRWATKLQQANNIRANHLLTWRGETHTVAEWARTLGLRRDSLYRRLGAGWSTERTLTTPCR